MNRKLYRVLDEIKKTEEKIAEWQEHLRELKVLAEQLENKEIIKTIRSMKLDSHRMLELLEGIQSGTVSVTAPDEEESTLGLAEEIHDVEEKMREVRGEAPEREDRKYEET